MKQNKLLVIPDIHQEISWVDKILQIENGNFDKVVLLGDLYDSFSSPKTIASVTETAKYVMELKQKMGDNLIVLIGNHDVPYYAVYETARKTNNVYEHSLSDRVKYVCGGYTPHKAIEIAKVVDREFIDSCKLCHIEDNILYSHAGLLSNFLNPFLTDVEVPNYIENICTEAWKTFPHIWNPLLEAGMSRGGCEVHGGITWCDISEFKDDIPLVQIFGHSTEYSRVSRIGKSFCIDGLQQIYAIVKNGFEINIKNAYNNIILLEKRIPILGLEQKVAKGNSYILDDIVVKTEYKKKIKIKLNK